MILLGQLLLLLLVPFPYHLRGVKGGSSFKPANYFHQSITHHRRQEDAIKINIGSNPLICFIYIYQ